MMLLAAGGSLDEMHIAVIDEDGGITGTAGESTRNFCWCFTSK